VIHNATLQRIDTQQPATAGGSVAYATGAAIAVRCTLDQPSFAQRTALGAVIAQATAVLYVRKADLTAGTVPAKGNRLSVQVDGDAAAQVYRIEHVVNWEKPGGLSHYQAYLRSE
jgi:hypothetical protein